MLEYLLDKKMIVLYGQIYLLLLVDGNTSLKYYSENKIYKRNNDENVHRYEVSRKVGTKS